MIGTLAAIILGKKSPIANNVEYFFVRHVFPEFRSPHGYLRARACDVLEKFSELDFQDHNVSENPQKKNGTGIMAKLKARTLL